MVTASASTSEEETDANSTDNSNSLQLNVVNPDLTITITANPMTPVVNNLVTYTATIKNNSPAVASNVFAILRLDTGNIISSTECNLDGPAFCNVGTIAGGQTVALHVVAQMPITAGDVKMTGTVTLDETDTNPADNAALHVDGWRRRRPLTDTCERSDHHRWRAHVHRHRHQSRP